MDTFEKALAECDAEPIHIPGVIQRNGALLAFDKASFTIAYVSENAEEFLGQAPDDLLGATAETIFGQHLSHSLRNVMQMPTIQTRREPVGSLEVGERALDIFVFLSDGYLVVELEEAATVPWSDADLAARIAELFQLVNQQTTVEGLLQTSVRWLSVLSGYDRVMVYRFKEDWSGEVVAERNITEHDDFLGMSFPRWDIPTQVREIMLRLPLRMITNTREEPARIRAATEDLPPLDIAIGHLRGVSPVHLQYLHNMKVEATLTLSIVMDGKLWGVISFHHHEPKVPSSRVRAILLPFIEYFSVKLAQLEIAEATATREQARALLDDIRRHHGEGADLPTIVTGNPMPLMQLFDAQGMAVRLSGDWQVFGRTVPAVCVQALIEEAQNTKSVVAVDEVNTRFTDPHWREEGLAGALAISLGGDDIAVIFREEIEAQIKWAGRPEKDISLDGATYRLSPRGSFDLYLETIQNRARPWRPIDFELAEGLAALFLQSEQHRRQIERQFFEDRDRQQKLMINELNHRVRNILALIRSVSRQARRSNASLQSYSAALENRIKALAVAHDLSNDTALSNVSLAEIVRTELAPYGDADSPRFTLTGDDKSIRPDLCPIFALVIHELSTNAAKYGALSSEDGTIAIAFEPDGAGMKIVWRETGGPDVIEPVESGFGTVLIENAVPFELDGRVDLRYEPSGVTAEIWLPDELLSHENTNPAPYIAQFPTRPPGKALANQDLGTALLLEDNYVIALDTESMLMDIGFKRVVTASSVERATKLLNRTNIQIGLLDMHLGDETSFAIARELVSRGIPVLFATGYGSDIGRPPGLDHLPLVTKPVDMGTLATEIERLLVPDPLEKSA